MAGNNGKLRIAATGDLHIRESDAGKWTTYFRKISELADVLLICGDLTDTGDEAEARVLANELQACTIPVVAVLGNHDYEKGRQKIIREIIQTSNVHILDGESVMIGGVGFAGVKGFGGGFDNHMLSMFGEQIMKSFVQEAVDEALHLDRALARLDQEYGPVKKIALLHYAPFEATVAGEPEAVYPFLGCSRLAEPIMMRSVQAVFHGHAHAGVPEGAVSENVRVFNVAIPVLLKAGFANPFMLYEIA